VGIIARKGLRTALRQPLVIVLGVAALVALAVALGFLYVHSRFGALLDKEIGIHVGQIFLYLASAERVLGFLASLAVGSAAIADDLRAGGLSFYFSRPITPRAYLAGKLLPSLAVVGAIAALPPVLLAIEALALSGDVRALGLLAKALLQGAVCTAALCAPTLFFSTLAHRRAAAAGLTFALYVGSSALARGLVTATGARWAHALSLPGDVGSVAQALYGETPDAPPLAAALVLLALSTGALALAYQRIRRVEIVG
jgi:ABC-type transport system involved in multi-copper enzyme maturation permease subunit